VSNRGYSVLAAVILVAFVTGCSLAGGTLGGREKCWPPSDKRVPSLFRGILRVDAEGGRLATNEGDVIPLKAGALRPVVGADGTGQLVSGLEVVARAGSDVTLFGGAGSDGALVVCDVEEVH